MIMQQIGEVAAKVVDPWAWYFAALKNPEEIGKSIPLHMQPNQGYYRTRRKGGQWEPVAIFYPDGSDTLVAYRNGREVPPEDVWTFCATNPITYEQYQAAIEGKGFEDEPPAPTVGHNSGDADPFDAIRLELSGEIEQADEFLKSEIQSQADADKAGIWAKRLGDLAKRADGEREREKAPHLQACREVDDKWRPLIADAKDKATALKRHVEPFLIAEKRKRDEEARKAREEAERQRLAAMQAQDEEQRAAALKAVQEAEKAADVKNASAGRTGARVSIRVEKVGVVTDYAKAAAALVAMQHKDMLETIDKLAQRAARSGMAFDGMEVREQEKVV